MLCGKCLHCAQGSCLFSGRAWLPPKTRPSFAEGSGEGANAEEALIAAKRNAIEKGIGTILLSQTEIENFPGKEGPDHHQDHGLGEEL